MERQIFIKQKIQLSLDNKVFYYYKCSVQKILTNDQPKQNIKLFTNRFNETVVPPYIQKELALGLEKIFKQYHNLTI